MHEDEWIAEIVRRFGAAPGAGHLGPGDDAALLPSPGADHFLVLTTDSMVEDTHFENAWLTDDELAARVLAVSLSDLAAMAARPVGALLSIETPELPGRVGHAFMDGIERTLKQYRFPLLGGNVTRTRGPLVVTSTLIGTVERGRELRRTGARPGDSIWVTGRPGAAARARKLLAAGVPRTAPATAPWRVVEPRIEEAWHMAALPTSSRTQDARCASSAIDLSDSLGIDLARLLRASDVGAELDLDGLLRRDRLGDSDVLDMLEGGEDYELLVTCPCEREDPTQVMGALTSDGAVAARIGSITETRDLVVRVNGERIDYTPRGWDPFATG